MLILGLVEAALELVPDAIAQEPAVVVAAKARGKVPHQTLLDEAVYHSLLQKLPNHEKRGRPDIVHRSLLTALDSVLARENRLRIFVHTYTGQIIQIQPGTRLPRRLPRFMGLIEQLLITTKVPQTKSPLLQLYSDNFEAYLRELKPSRVFLLAQEGTLMTPNAFGQQLHDEANPIVLIGGFAHGSISSNITDHVDQRVCLDPELLPASTVIGMIIHSLENILNLADHRFSKPKETP